MSFNEYENEDGKLEFEREEYNYGTEESQGWNFTTKIIDGEIDNTAYKLVNLANTAIRLYVEGTYTLNGYYPEAYISVLDFYKPDFEDHYILKVTYSTVEIDTFDFEENHRNVADSYSGSLILRCLHK